jgi:hypothetical protein
MAIYLKIQLLPVAKTQHVWHRHFAPIPKSHKIAGSHYTTREVYFDLLFAVALHHTAFTICISSSNRFTSGLQLPQPMPAPVAVQRLARLSQPAAILLRILPAPTLLQLHTSLPKTGSAVLPLRSSLQAFIA